MVGLTKDEWIALVVWIVAVYWQPSFLKASYKKYKGIYTTGKKMGYAMPPAYVFGWVWFVIFATTSAGIFLYWQKSEINNITYQTITFTLFISNLFFNKLWGTLYFTLELYFLSVVDSIMIFLTIGAVAGLTGYQAYESGNNKNLWASFSLFLPYVLWSIYAIYLTASSHGVIREMKKNQAMKKTAMGKLKNAKPHSR